MTECGDFTTFAVAKHSDMKYALTFCLLAGIWSGWARTPQADVPSAATPRPEAVSVETLAAEVETLKTKSSGWDKVLSRLPRISGYVQLGYEWTENTSTFFIKRVRLNLAGRIVPKLDYRVQIEFASPKIVDAYLNYSPFRQLNVKLGEYKVPFSIENTEYPPLGFEFIEYPLALRKLMGFEDICGLSATGRDMGATLYGGFFGRDGYSILNYDLGVFNGEGINTKDRNRSKDIAARVTVKPLPGLQISGSCYWGEYGAEYLERIRYGVGACYDRGPAVVRAEWIGGTTGLPAGDRGDGGELESAGWYVAAGWRATRTLQPVVRYDTFRENASLSDSRQTNYTAGLLWQPVKYLRCQLNYTYEDFAARSAPNRNVVSLMFSGIF